jgi:hypothetical protein
MAMQSVRSFIPSLCFCSRLLSVGDRYYPGVPRGGAPELEDYLEDLVPPLPDLDWADGGGQGEMPLNDLLDNPL